MMTPQRQLLSRSPLELCQHLLQLAAHFFLWQQEEKPGLLRERHSGQGAGRNSDFKDLLWRCMQAPRTVVGKQKVIAECHESTRVRDRRMDADVHAEGAGIHHPKFFLFTL